MDPMSDKILCPTDFSVDSEHALRVAVRLAIERDAELVIAHVWHLPSFAFAGEAPIPGEVVSDMIRISERDLAAAAGRATSLGATRVSTMFLRGVPWDQIVKAADDRAFDLVVMGRRGRSGVARFLVGSVTERVIRHAACSVLAVPPDAAIERTTHVLCPVDFSEGSSHAMQLAAGLAGPRGEVTLLHVVEIDSSYTGGFTDGSSRVDKLAIHLLENAAEELRAKFDVAVTTRIELGHPAHHILKALETTAAFDLVVVGSHGRTGIRRLFLGSVAEKVVRHANCSVYVARVRAPGPALEQVEELPHTD